MSNKYTQTVIEHFKNPRNVGVLEDADVVAEVGSPECGDSITVYLKIEDDKIVDIRYQTFGCAAAIASSSVASELVKGMSLCEAYKVSKQRIADALGGLPAPKLHCSLMVEDGIKEAIRKYLKEKKGVNVEEYCK